MKRLFTLISILAIVHLAALFGLVGFAWSQGWLTKDRITGAMDVLAGKVEEEDDSADKLAAADDAPKSTSELIRRNVEQEEIARLDLDRRETEIQNGWRMLETRELALLREQETFRELKKLVVVEEEKRASEASNSGVKKELEIISGLKAKDAKELLKLKDDADVVRIFMEMESRKARKIVGACKTGEERSWIERILGKLHERDATQAEDLGTGL